MLVHKSGQINNVQLITGVRIAEMSQLQNCSVMCTKNGSYWENGKKRKKVRGRGMCTKNGSYCEKEKVWGGQGRCERRSEAFVKIQKKIYIYIFFLGGSGWGGGGGQGGCERRSEAFVKISFFIYLGGGVSGRVGGRLGGQGGCERKSEVFVKIQKKTF